MQLEKMLEGELLVLYNVGIEVVAKILANIAFATNQE